MSSPSLPERLAPATAALNAAMTQLSGSLRVAVPAIVQSFNAEAQTVVVKSALLENIRVGGQQRNVDLGLIADVPVQVYRAGKFSLTLPIQPGDECDLIFQDGCIDAWFQSGGQQARIDGRRHSLSDPVAFFGLSSQPRVLANYSTTSAQLRSDDSQTVIDLGDGEITISAANVTVTGSQQVTVSGNNQTTVDGRVFLEHTHTLSGGGVTGPVV